MCICIKLYLYFKEYQSLSDSIFNLSENQGKVADSEEAQEEIQRLASFPEVNPNPIVEIDFNGTISYLNSIAKAKFPDIQKSGLSHPFFSDWLHIVNSFKGKLVATFNREIKIGENWYSQQFYLLPETDRIRIYSTNIDAQKKAQEQLAKKEEELQTIIDSSRMWIFYKDKENNFLRVNKAFAEVMGMPREQLEGSCLFDLYPKAEAESFWSDDQQVIKSGVPKIGIIETMESKKGKLWVETDKVPFRDSQGNIIGVIGFTTDITERKKAEEALKKQADLIDLSPDAIIVRKLDGTITFWNNGAERIYGWTRQEAIGQKKHVLMRTESKITLEEIFAQLKQVRYWSGELTHFAKDGRPVVVQSYWLGRLDKDGNLDEIYESNTDVTERKLLQEKLQENATLLKKYANQMEKLADKRLKQLRVSERLAVIGQTAGMVGHDIRNPLQAIIGDLFLIEQEINTNPRCKDEDIVESIAAINENITYINKIVSDLQDYTRTLKPNLAIVNLNDIVASALSGRRIASDIEVEVQAEADLNLNTDPTFLRRILANLITNAIQAMQYGGKLTIGAFKDNNGIFICIQDTGVGIKEEDKPHLFKPLFTTKAKGQGLGLAVVKRLIEALNGKISFESQEGKGTKFVIELPSI